MLEFIFYCFIFFLGATFGSFLNVVIDRFPFNKSIFYPPSHCPHCKHKLAVLDLVPILSFLFIKGRCRYCNSRISRYYPLIETVTGLLFTLTTYVATGNPPLSPFNKGGLLFSSPLDKGGLGGIWSAAQTGFLIYLLAIVSILIVIFFIDLKYGIIPFKIIFLGLLLITAQLIIPCHSWPQTRNLYQQNSWIPPLNGGITMCKTSYIFEYFITGISTFLLFFLLFYFSKGRAIGFGDVFFSLLMGYLLGFPNIVVSVYIAFLTGAFISLILILARKKKFKGGTIPFGPFLVLGTITSLFWGSSIINLALLYLRGY